MRLSINVSEDEKFELIKLAKTDVNVRNMLLRNQRPKLVYPEYDLEEVIFEETEAFTNGLSVTTFAVPGDMLMDLIKRSKDAAIVDDLREEYKYISDKYELLRFTHNKLWYAYNYADIAAFNAASEQEYVDWCESIGRAYEEQDERAEEAAWIKEQGWKWNSNSRAARFARKHNLSREDAEKWYDVAAKNTEKGFETSHTRTQFSFIDWFAAAEEEFELIMAAAAESDTELNTEPDDDEDVPF